jgi:hypothetical protein
MLGRAVCPPARPVHRIAGGRLCPEASSLRGKSNSSDPPRQLYERGLKIPGEAQKRGQSHVDLAVLDFPQPGQRNAAHSSELGLAHAFTLADAPDLSSQCLQRGGTPHPSGKIPGQQRGCVVQLRTGSRSGRVLHRFSKEKKVGRLPFTGNVYSVRIIRIEYHHVKSVFYELKIIYIKDRFCSGLLCLARLFIIPARFLKFFSGGMKR